MYILLLRRVTIQFEQVVVYNIYENAFLFRKKKEKGKIQRNRTKKNNNNKRQGH